jgi:hypothetical protein
MGLVEYSSIRPLHLPAAHCRACEEYIIILHAGRKAGLKAMERFQPDDHGNSTHYRRFGGFQSGLSRGVYLSWRRPFGAAVGCSGVSKTLRTRRNESCAAWHHGALCTWWFAVTPYAAAESASESLKSILEKAIDIKTRADLQGAERQTTRARLVRELIAENFLSAEMARESVKDYWDSLSQEQRQDFTGLFIDLFQDSYTRLVLNYLRQETIEYSEQPSAKVRLQTRPAHKEHIR